ncbi:DNA polymerase III subunit delta [Lacticaseibacillus daqingensis]|uniref:DNA polymerase III subunit delta n=1 Tax=Lacticaseibacillus daqingensis TaxID=2486014 RepID=UPI000F790768|nr:DNA polymerase III subunit delta [Lacticaseibacillus daqingensis]
MQVDELIRQLKQGVRPPVVVLLGTEQALVDRALAALAAVVPDDQVTMNLARYDMRQTPVAVALDDAMSPPFFGDFREVVITDPFFLTGESPKVAVTHDLDGLTAYLQHPVESTLMVLVAPYAKLDERKRLTKALKKVATIVDVKPLDQRAAQNAVRQALKQQKSEITPAALAALVQRTAGDYSVMMRELPKLALYGQGGSPLDEAAIDALVPKHLTDRVFDLVAAVVAQNATLALSLYRDLLLQKEEPIRLNSLLISQFRLLLQTQILAQQGYSQGSLATTLKVHPYRVKLALQQVNRVSGTALRAAYQGLVETETAMKTGRVDKALAFELFVLRYCGGGALSRREA